MILYFADRKMNILGQASTGLPSGLLIFNDKKTEDIDYGTTVLEFDLSYDSNTRNKAKEYAKVGNYILTDSGNDTKFYTIIDSESDTSDCSYSIYAEDAGLDLLNEIANPYEADQAYPASHYINMIINDSGFEIGINEISDLNRKLIWTGEDTVTARLLSIATQFDNAEIAYSFKVDKLKITNKYVNIYKKRGTDEGIELRLDRDVDSISVKESIANLATALNVKGGTPENSDTPITLNGYSYDDNDFYVSGSLLKSRNALSKWSRYLSETGTDEGYIVQNYNYDTDSQSELCNRAVTYLKKICEPEVNYEVEVALLPDSVKIGDKVNIVDSKGNLYLSSRLLKLIESESDNTRTATLGEFLIKEYDISTEVQALADEFSKLAATRQLYTWIVWADDELGTNISLEAVNKPYMGTATNRTTKEPDISDPSIYEWVQIKGNDGANGEPGPIGPSGEDGAPGTDGEDGHDGVSVTAIEKEYYLSNSATIQNGGKWSSDMPEWKTGWYIWSRERTTWSTGAITYSSPLLEKAINSANTTADKKNTVFYASTPPTTTGRRPNDIWFDTSNEYKMYFWVDGKWSEALLGATALDILTVQRAVIANLEAGCITADKLDVQDLSAVSALIANIKIIKDTVNEKGETIPGGLYSEKEYDVGCKRGLELQDTGQLHSYDTGSGRDYHAYYDSGSATFKSQTTSGALPYNSNLDGTHLIFNNPSGSAGGIYQSIEFSPRGIIADGRFAEIFYDLCPTENKDGRYTGQHWINGKEIHTKTFEMDGNGVYGYQNIIPLRVSEKYEVDEAWVDLQNSYMKIDNDNRCVPLILTSVNLENSQAIANSGYQAQAYIRPIDNTLVVEVGKGWAANRIVVTVRYTYK